MPVSGAIIIAIASLVGILELPFCCTSLTVCKQIQPYMATFEAHVQPALHLDQIAWQ